MVVLTKTLFVQGIRCKKLLYISSKKKETIPEDSLGVKFRKEQGTKVGELAKKLYPEGVDLSNQSDEEKVNLTLEKSHTTLFEASARYNELFARADILVPQNDGSFNIIEVKSDTELKPEHIPDVAFQKYVFQKAGFSIKNVFLAHINNEYVRNGNIDVSKLFNLIDLNEKIDLFIDNIEDELTKQLAVMKSEEIPEAIICQSCIKPYICSMKGDCWGFLPKNNVTELFYGKSIGFELLKNNIQLIKDIPSDTKLKLRPKQQAIQINATKENKAHIDKNEIKKFVESLHYPIYHFDFETYAPAIPFFDNSRGWQQIPFQYSLHIEQKDGSLYHREFIETNRQDPRIGLIEAMKRDLGTTGTILVYNQNFEKRIIKELIRDFPEFEKQGNNYLERIEDLAFPFEKFHYYNPKQRGRYSIKIILPLFTELTYKGMNIGNGEEAFVNYEKYLLNNSPTQDKIIEDLKKYCELDTYAEVKILESIKKALLQTI